MREYPIDHNATQAAIRAGYSAHTAREQGRRLLTRVHITRALAPIEQAALRKVEKLERKCALSLERVLDEAAILAFSDIADVVTWTQNDLQLVPSDQLSREQTATIQSIQIHPSKFGVRRGIRLHSKTAAISSLIQHYLHAEADEVNEAMRTRFDLIGQVTRDILTGRLGETEAAESMREIIRTYRDRAESMHNAEDR